MDQMQFMKMFMKSGSNAERNKYIRQCFEMEVASKRDVNDVASFLRNYGKGHATQEAFNTGNGFNADTHRDGTVSSRDRAAMQKGYHDVETSTSPLHSVDYNSMREEIAMLVDIYKKATGGCIHSAYASCHVHNSLAYFSEYGVFNVIDGLPIYKVYRYLGLFIMKYMPALKWISMTTPQGARGTYDNPYDKLENDKLFSWFAGATQLGTRFNDGTDDYLTGMGRESYFRAHRTDALHWEMRMCDNTASPTHIASWLALNRAITLWAIYFAINDLPFKVTSADYTKSQTEMVRHRRGWQEVNKGTIQQMWAEMKGYLIKFFKASNSMDAIAMLDRLVEYPIPQYLMEKDIGTHYDLFTVIEKSFNIRNRPKDVELRENYLYHIKAMLVPIADNLVDFHKNVANALGISETQAKSLYQMFKRDNIELEFLGGRLQYMGD